MHMMPWKTHWKCRTTITCAYTYTHAYVRCVVECVCKCACIYISKPKYLRTHCTVMKHQRLLLALQSVPLLSMPCPTSACSSLSDCPAWNAALPTLATTNCSRNTLPVLLMTRCLNLGVCLHVPDVCSARFDHRNVRPAGWASWSREEQHLAWSLHLPSFPGVRQKSGFSLGEVNQRGTMHSRRWDCMHANGLCH